MNPEQQQNYISRINDMLNSVRSFADFWSWFLLQPLGLQIFLSAVAFGIIFAGLIMIFSTLQLED